MQVIYPRISATTLEGKAIVLAKPVVDRISANHSVKIKIGTSGQNQDIVCKTIVSKKNKSLFEKLGYFLRLIPRSNEGSYFKQTSSGLTENNIANHIIRDVQNAIGKFDATYNPKRQKYNRKGHKSEDLLLYHYEIMPASKILA